MQRFSLHYSIWISSSLSSSTPFGHPRGGGTVFRSPAQEHLRHFSSAHLGQVRLQFRGVFGIGKTCASTLQLFSFLLCSFGLSKRVHRDSQEVRQPFVSFGKQLSSAVWPGFLRRFSSSTPFGHSRGGGADPPNLGTTFSAPAQSVSFKFGFNFAAFSV